MNDLPDGQTASGSSARLVPLESPVEPPDIYPLVSPPPFALDPKPPFAHTGWANDRKRVLDALLHAEQSSSRIRAFVDCSSAAWVLRHRTDLSRFKFVANCCHDRLCQKCSGMRTATVRTNLLAFLDGRESRFVTLTKRHTDRPLTDQLDDLYKCFRRLRQRTLWKERVTGGCAMLELEYNHASRRWHPHLHILLEGDFIPLADLKKAWLDVTGDSHVVDIRRVKNDLGAARYLTKYLAKALPAHILRTVHLLREAVSALRSRRFLLTFGTWSKAKLTEPPSDDEWEAWDHVTKFTDGTWPDHDFNAAVRLAYWAWCDGESGGEFAFHGHDPPPPDPCRADKPIPFATPPPEPTLDVNPLADPLLGCSMLPPYPAPRALRHGT